MNSVFAALWIWGSFSFSQAGVLVGNGGDAVECRAQADSPFVGLYSLDYLLTFQEGNHNSDIANVKSLSESLTRIRAQLALKLPELIESWDSFVKYYRNTQNKLAPRFWEEAPFGLVNLQDEAMVSLVPSNCRNGNSVALIQAVIRQNPQFSGTLGTTIVYKFFPKILDQLEQNAALQASFLLVHEWLWDVSKNVDRNRRVNRLLHSRALEDLPAKELRELLANFGLTLPKQLPPVLTSDICPPNPAQVAEVFALEEPHFANTAISTLQVYARDRLCYGDEICYGDWVDISDSISKGLGLEPFRVIIPGSLPKRLEFWSRNSFGQVIVHAQCRVDEKTAQVSCYELKGPNGFAFKPFSGKFENTGDSSIQLEGSLNRECLKVSARGILKGLTHVGEPYTEQFEIAIYSRFP